MSAPHGEAAQAALGWLARLNDPDFEDWDAWEAWLVQDPAHAEAYWRLAEAEAEIVDGLTAAPVPAGLAPPAARRTGRPRAADRPNALRRWAPRLAAAAAVVLVLGGLWSVWLDRPQVWTVETEAGESRSVQLADGTEVHLDGGTAVRLDRARPRHAVLERGRMLVEVTHDDRRPFLVEVGDATLTDLGTAFDVTRLSDGLRVDVSEGVVRVDLDRQAVTLRAGEGLEAAGGEITRRNVAPAEVGAWRAGRLVYRDERLAVVAEDLGRALGLPVSVAPEIADRRFTGSLSMDGTPEAIRERLELALDVQIAAGQDGWRLKPRPAA